jgi:outer membrane protein assembly factor BamE (lipoprotein component of BamABCDE complex)
MKLPQLLVCTITIIIAFTLLAVITTVKEANSKRECTNQGSCPKEKINDDNIFFMNPLNRFIAVI